MSINTPAGPGPLPADPPHRGTGPDDARTGIRRINHNGGTHRAHTSLAQATAPGLTRGRPTRAAAAAMLTVTADDAPRARLDATGTRLRLRALHVMGHNCVRIARALDVGETAIRELVRGSARTVSPELRDAVADLYDAWWDKRAPARTPSSAARPPSPANAPSPGTGAPAPPWTTTCSTSPATSRPGAGNPPPAPAPPPTSTCRSAATRRTPNDHR